MNEPRINANARQSLKQIDAPFSPLLASIRVHSRFPTSSRPTRFHFALED